MKGKRILAALGILLLVATSAVLGGCIRVDRGAAEGQFANRVYDNLTGFTKIEIGSAFQLEVIPSDNYSVALYAGQNFLDRLDVRVRGDTLVFSVKGWFFSFDHTPRAVVTMPVLDGLDLSGAVSAAAGGFSDDKPFDLKVSGASNLHLDLVTGPFRAEVTGASSVTGSLTAPATDIELSGASSCDLDGSGGDVRLDVSGASRAELSGYDVANADVDLSGASTAYLNAAGRIDAGISGASRLTYLGAPTIGTLDVSGGSSIKHVE